MFQLSFIKSRSLKIRSHVPSTVGPGKEDLNSTLGSLKLDHMAALGSSFISCSTVDKTIDVQRPEWLLQGHI